MNWVNFGNGEGQTLEFAQVWGPALDLVAQTLYWTDNFGGDIHRANLDGTDVSAPLVTGLATPRGIALDLAASRIYWTEAFPSTISRAGLDGSNPELVLDDATGVDESYGIYIDPAGPAKLYWTNSGGASATAG